MAQNKLENQIKEKLNSREIQPSAQAWDRLDAMLSVAEEKKTKRSFGWLYIAAGVTVLLSAGLFFFNQESTKINTNETVVGTESTVVDSIQNQKTIQMPISPENKVAVQDNPSTATQQPSTNHQGVSINSQNSINHHSNQNNNHEKSNNQIIRDQEIKYENSSDVAIKDLPKTVEPKEITFNGSKNSTALTDEQLVASLDNSAKKSSKKAGVEVDAKKLLSQVDGELEMTFREKVIDKVSKKYKKIEVALANRNNE